MYYLRTKNNICGITQFNSTDIRRHEVGRFEKKHISKTSQSFDIKLGRYLIIKYFILSIHKFVTYDPILIIFWSQICLQNTIKLVRDFGDRRMFSSKVLGVILDTVSNVFVMYLCFNVS